MSPRGRPTVQVAFGEVVRKLRKKRGLSQEGLAHQADFHRNYIGLIERGEKSATVDALFRLAATLDVRPRDLIAQTEALTPVPRPRQQRRS